MNSVWQGQCAFHRKQRAGRGPSGTICGPVGLQLKPLHIVGWSLAEGRVMLAELLEHATQRDNLSQHRELRRTTTEERITP
jgi:hypothetical protein